MPLNIRVHAPLATAQGVALQAPTLDNTSTFAQVVALGNVSTAIQGPCIVCLNPDEDQRIGAAPTPGYNAPAASGVKIRASQNNFFALGTGPWYISCVAG
jgi:hypothetical protein